VPTREWRELYARSTAPPLPRSTLLHGVDPRVEKAGRPVVGSAPVGHDGTAAWLDAIGDACNVAADKVARRRTPSCRRSKGALAKAPINGTITLSGYEGSELLVAGC
jgi:chlorophyllide a reductase subunit Y